METDYKRLFLKEFNTLSENYSPWSVWQDFIYLTAASIANAVDRRADVWEKREDEYKSIIRKYKTDEQMKFVNLFVLTTLALEENPAQDFLGSLYMELNLSNHWKGQFFTPWDIAELKANLVESKETLESQIRQQHYISVNDPACGAGCILLAFAYLLWNHYGINYQESVLFIGQDVDPVVAKMCYIQLSLLGCPGYVIIGNTITEPVTKGTTLQPIYDRPGDLWFTPFYYSDTWSTRIAIEKVLILMTTEHDNKESLNLPSELIIFNAEDSCDSTVIDTPARPIIERNPKKPGGFSFRKFFKLDDD